MRRWLLAVLAVCPLVVAVLIGCEAMLRPVDSGAEDTSGAASGGRVNSSATGGGGEFIDPGGDPEEVRPERVEVDEEGLATFSHFRAVQIDPVPEDSAGPKFAKTFDIDNDGLPDLVTAWNQSQPVQIHLQRRDDEGKVSFVAVNLGGTAPMALIGGVDMADFDGDSWLDVVLAIKTTGGAPLCPKPGGTPPYAVIAGADTAELQILFSPGSLEEITDGDAWQEVRLARTQLPGRRDKGVSDARTFPEFNSYTGIAAGEIDGINGPDIAVMFNPATCEYYGDDPPTNRLMIMPNPGGVGTRDPGVIPLTATADAGEDASVPVPDPSEPTPTGMPVALNGYNSSTSYFSTPSFYWEQVSGPNVSLAGAGSPAPQFIAPTTPAALSFKLSASAGDMTDYDYVNVMVGDPGTVPPVVIASGDQAVIPDTLAPEATVIFMTATASDPNGDPLTYSWEQVYGTPVTLTGATSPTAAFTPPQEGGEFRFRVTVSDGTYYDSDLVVITSGVWAPIWLAVSRARAGDVALCDVDYDGDNDLVYTFPSQITANISWVRNPQIPHDVLSPSGAEATHWAGNWQTRPVGQVDTEASVLAVADIDRDGFDDVLVRSGEGKAVQWFRNPGAADLEPIFPPPDVVPDRFNFPWQVYSVAEYDFRTPAGIAAGDLTGDGFNEVVVAAGGVVYWYDASTGGNPYDEWEENFLIDDTKARAVTDDPEDPDFEDSGTVINWLTVVDIDQDGFGDVIGTLDRRSLSGLTEDTLIWFRNTLGDQAAEAE